MSDSMWPHRRQPTRLPHPWDSPGNNTGLGCHFLLQCMKVKSESEVAQLCPTLSNPKDCSLPASSVHGIFRARVLEWAAIAFSRGSFWSRDPTHVFCIDRWILNHWATRGDPVWGYYKWNCSWYFCVCGHVFIFLNWMKVKVKSLSCVQLFATPWTVAYQASQSMGFSRQAYWNRLPFPSPGDLPNPVIKSGSPAL